MCDRRYYMSALKLFMQCPPKFMHMVSNPSRQAGKSAALAAAYGTGRHGGIVREHPLQYVSGFTYVENDRTFRGVPTYKVTTKVISEIMRKDRVPHTEVYYRMMDTMETQVGPNVAALAWIRRGNHEDIRTAIATLLMMGKEVVIVRAFEP
jgi:hypothetical protein